MASIHNVSRVRAIDHLASIIAGKLPKAGYDAARRMHAEVVRLRQGVEALGNMHATPNPLDSTPAHEKRVATAAKKFAAEVDATSSRIQEITRSGLLEIDKRIAVKVNLTPNPTYAAEIRAAFRSMDQTARVKLMGEMVAANRGPELAAIVKAPAMLTGITEEMQQRYTEAIIAEHAPDEYAEQSVLTELLSVALTATPVAREASDAYSDPAKLASIERDEAAAAAAAAAFAEAIAPAA